MCKKRYLRCGSEDLSNCIPKGPCWSGRINEVRPITLLEHGRKILFSILVERLTAIFMSKDILKGPNFSVLKGTMTKDPIHILNAVMEDAREFNKEAWVLFQDMRRCFDSVSCHDDGMLDRALRWLKIPSSFRRLCLDIAATKTNRVITAYGLTEEYHPRCGLDQGGVECPLFWRISYEILLTAVMDAGLGYPFMRQEALRAHYRLPAIPVYVEEEPETSVSALAFVDDTIWIAPSKSNLQAIADIALSFFDLNSIEINSESLSSSSSTPHRSPEISIWDKTSSSLVPLMSECAC